MGGLGTSVAFKGKARTRSVRAWAVDPRRPRGAEQGLQGLKVRETAEELAGGEGPPQAGGTPGAESGAEGGRKGGTCGQRQMLLAGGCWVGTLLTPGQC